MTGSDLCLCLQGAIKTLITLFAKLKVYHNVPPPRFATLVLVKSIGGAYMQDQTFYLTNIPPLPVPHLDVDIGTLYYRPIEAGSTPIFLCFSRPPETRWSRSTDRGW